MPLLRNRLSWWDEVYALPYNSPLAWVGLGVAALSVFALLYWLWQLTRPRDFIPFEDFKTQNLEAGDWTIRYHQSGQGPHLLLLHGIGANLYCWRQILPLLNRKFTVTAIDLPGFGRSSKPAGAGYGLDEQTERLAKILDALGIRRTYIVGNSMGGNIALWFGLKFPDRTQGLGLIAPATSAALVPPLEKLAWLSAPASLFLSRPAMWWAHGRTVSKRSLVDRDRVEETYFTYGRQPGAVRSFLLATSAIRDSRLISALKDLQTKVVILWGSNDRLVNRKTIDALRTALPKAESFVHVGGGHHLQEDEPEWVSEKLSEFFQA